jgi:pimeloyl-ACP methyl ester carboxylesterase
MRRTGLVVVVMALVAGVSLGLAARAGFGGPDRCMVGRWNHHGCRGTAQALADGAPTNVRCVLSGSSQQVTYQAGEITLAGDLYRGRGAPPRPGLVLLHGGSVHGRRLPIVAVLADRFAKRGYTVLTPDLRGYGESEDPADLSDPAAFDFAQDVVSSLDLLESLPDVDRGRLYVVGHSFGAGIALAAQARDRRIAKLVLIGPPRRLQERFLDAGAADSAYVLARTQEDMQLPEQPSMTTWRPVIESVDIERYLDYWTRPGHIPLFLMDSEREDADDLAFLREIHGRMAPTVEYWTLPKTDHYLHTGRLLGRACYNAGVIGPFTDRVDAWLRRSGGAQQAER